LSGRPRYHCAARAVCPGVALKKMARPPVLLFTLTLIGVSTDGQEWSFSGI